MLGASAASASTLPFTESFEEPSFKGKWAVFADGITNWKTTDGQGIEIQKNGTIRGVSAHHGAQYVELDSDRRKGGSDDPDEGSNSSMTWTGELDPGRYHLEWFYLPRTSKKDDNAISVYFSGDENDLHETLLGTQNETRPPIKEWVRTLYIFNVEETGKYAITFKAGGKENTLGGFVDSVTLSEVPLPAAGWMLVAGLGGIAAMKRRRKS
ncbi:MAG: VPLPA-CTERM sorting domain-containing protein [Rhodobacteraceae bacterium]|nr:VPLPA-CTERM sorting domain-containing protein [Paracoccaceae bacterium]